MILKQEGFSLIEVVVSLLLLSIALLGWFHYQHHWVTWQHSIDNRESALSIANNQLEQIAAMNPIHLGTVSNNQRNVMDDFEVDVSITAQSDYLYQVLVTVYWGRQHSVQLSTLLAVENYHEARH